MDEEVIFCGKSVTKAKAVASVANSLIDEIINNCHRHRGVGDYFDLAVIGYGGDTATPLWGGGFKRITDINAMVTTSESEMVSLRMPDGRVAESVVERRCWIEPRAEGKTPMGDALRIARRLSAAWCRRNSDSFPPLVVNITDGEATDTTPEGLLTLTEKLTSTSTFDGSTLLINIHIASEYDIAGTQYIFPSHSEKLPDNRYTQLLYQISSTMPDIFNCAIAKQKGFIGQPPYKALCYNCSANQLIGLLNIGSLTLERMV